MGRRIPTSRYYSAANRGWIDGLSREDFFIGRVHSFVDEHTFDLKRLMKCCIHELLPDDPAGPFCACNNLGYWQRVKQEAAECLEAAAR